MKIPTIPLTSMPKAYLKFSTTATKTVSITFTSQFNNDMFYYELSFLLYKVVLIKSILSFHE